MAKEKLAVDFDDVLFPLWNSRRLVPPDKWALIASIYGRNADTLPPAGRSAFIEIVQEDLANVEPIAGSYDTFSEAKLCYDSIYIITGRYKDLQATTENFVNKHFPNIFEDISYTARENNVRSSKHVTCQQLGAAQMVDDWIYSSWHPSIGRILYGDYPHHDLFDVESAVQRARTHEELGRILIANADGRWRL
jgi:hypothetical protein